MQRGAYAAEHLLPTPKGEAMDHDVLKLHRHAVEHFDRQVEAIGPDQWNLPTPCTDWDVRALVNHLVYENDWSVPLLHGATIAEVGDRFEGDLLGDDPKATWRRSSQEALAAAAEDGVLDRSVSLSSGPRDAGAYLAELFCDHLIHGWDLARAIGGDERLDPDLTEACYAMSKPREDRMKASGAFGERITVADDADLQTKLLAVYGRTA